MRLARRFHPLCAQGSLDEGGGQQALILRLTATLPCNNLERAQAFFERLGFSREESLDEAPSHLQTQARLCCGLAGVSLRCRCPDLGAGVADRSVAGGVTTGRERVKDPRNHRSRQAAVELRYFSDRKSQCGRLLLLIAKAADLDAAKFAASACWRIVLAMSRTGRIKLTATYLSPPAALSVQ